MEDLLLDAGDDRDPLHAVADAADGGGYAGNRDCRRDGHAEVARADRERGGPDEDRGGAVARPRVDP